MAEAVRGLKFVLSVEGDAKTEAAVKRVDKAVDNAGQTAGKAATGGMGKLKAAFADVSGTVDKASAAFGKAMGALGAVGAAVGAAVLVFKGLTSAFDAINAALDEGTDRFRVLTEETAKARSGLSDISSQVDAYAKSLGLASEKMLTFGERQAALARIARGEAPDTFDTAGQRAAQIAALREGIGKAQGGVFGMGTGFMESELKRLEAEQARYERMQVGLRMAASGGGAGGWFDDEGTRKRGGGGGGGRASAAAAKPMGDLFGIGAAMTAQRSAATNQRNQAWAASQGAAISSAVAGIPNVDAATQAIQQLRLAQDAAFDTALMEQWADVFNSATEQFGKGLAQSAANALLFGSSFTKSINQAMKALAAHAASESLFEGAAAVASLALGRPEAAALHAQAAALYAGVATIAALGAAASGGLRSGQQGGAGAGGGRAPRSQDFGPRATSGGPQKQEITVVIDADRLGGKVAYAVDRRTGSRVDAGLVTTRSQRS